MKKEQPEATNVATVCDKDSPDAALMEAYMREHGVTAVRYTLRDLDRLNGDVNEGRIKRVIFVRAEDLLEGIFNDEIRYGRWLTTGTQVELVEPAGTDTAACLAATARAWERHCVKHRRRQVVAGLILGTIAVAAAFIVVRL